MYFNEKPQLETTHIETITDSTTEYLDQNFFKTLINPNGFDNDSLRIYRDIVNHALAISSESGLAVTRALFKDELDRFSSAREADVAHNSLARSISRSYVTRYLEIYNGTVITGIPGLQEYDGLATNPLQTHLPTIEKVLSLCGLRLSDERVISTIIQFKRNTELFMLLQKSLYDALHSYNSIPRNELSKNLLIDMKSFIKRDDRTQTNSPSQESIIFRLDMVNTFINNRFGDAMLNKHAKSVEEIKKNAVVILAATETELEVLKDLLIDSGIKCADPVAAEVPYYEIIGYSFPVFVANCLKGSIGPASSINTVNKIIKQLDPEYILMGGIAFGLQREKQAVSDILVAEQVWDYERAKVTDNTTIDRGSKYDANGTLIQTIRLISSGNSKYRFHYGLFASGEKLVNNAEFKAKLLDAEPECIGGDMEAAGLASACHNSRTGWLVAKAISDWGESKQDDAQVNAAKASFQALLKVLDALNRAHIS